jgi:hypothetical protein
LKVEEHEVGGKVCAVHEFEPRASPHDNLEVGGVSGNPTIDAIEEHFMIIK